MYRWMVSLAKIPAYSSVRRLAVLRIAGRSSTGAACIGSSNSLIGHPPWLVSKWS
jgi:hypothetical protein